MYKATSRKHAVEKSKSFREKETKKQSSNFFAKHLKRIYPVALQRSTSSSFSFSSISLSLSQNSNDSFVTDSTSTLEQKISLALGLISSPERRESPVPRITSHQQQQQQQSSDSNGGQVKRCNWITKTSDEVYVTFHDEQWGVPVYDDNRLFELLAMSGMLMDFNWTEILKRKELFREAFVGFDPNIVAKMGEKEITEIASNKAIMLQESRVRCIVDNANCIVELIDDSYRTIVQVVREYGSFSSFMWGFMDYKPMINRFKHPRNVPLRTPKAEAISKDLLKRGFRFVGPVIVYSFMQAAGLVIDHLVDCFRHGECVSLAERPWRHI